MKPVYEMAVMNLQSVFPEACDARLSSGDERFRDTMREALWLGYKRMDSDDGDALCRQMFEYSWEQEWKPRFIPDLWAVDPKERMVHLFEIEDTHPLTHEKLMKLHQYWWDMDAIGWSLTLRVFDRYGMNQRDLDLTKYAFHMLPVIKRENEGPNQPPQRTAASRRL